VSRLVLTNCENYDKFPPDALERAAALCRAAPRLGRALIRLQVRSSAARRRLVDACTAIPREDRPVLLVWGEACDFFPLADAERLAADFPDATLISVPAAKTWVPIDAPGAVTEAIVGFVPTPLRD
jgi:pimeloyl-ACP methyl ester carboxylesterase